MPLPLTVSCYSKIQIGLPIWYGLTRVVPEKGPLNGCVLVYRRRGAPGLLCPLIKTGRAAAVQRQVTTDAGRESSPPRRRCMSASPVYDNEWRRRRRRFPFSDACSINLSWNRGAAVAFVRAFSPLPPSVNSVFH